MRYAVLLAVFLLAVKSGWTKTGQKLASHSADAYLPKKNHVTPWDPCFKKLLWCLKWCKPLTKQCLKKCLWKWKWCKSGSHTTGYISGSLEGKLGKYSMYGTSSYHGHHKKYPTKYPKKYHSSTLSAMTPRHV
uniref:KRMPlx1 n=1 Tax=Pinctada maxima TaxID=104660 RepID=M1RFK7_PINMA|nr:KRMPlx1 [Pinctada maxima]